jgi:Cu/Ag efflux pump CusA
MPALQDRDVSIHVGAAAGTSLPEMTRLVARMTSELRALPGVSNAGAQIGRAVMSDSSANPDAANVWVTIGRTAPYAATVASIRSTVAGYPGLRTSVANYSTDRTNEVLAGSADPVVVRIYGTDYGVLQSKAGQVKALLSSIRGVVNPQIEPVVYEPSVQVEVNIAAAERYGVKPGDIRREATLLVQGLGVGSIFQDQKVFDVVVKGVDALRTTPAGIENLLIDTPSGKRVRLGDVAAVRIVPAPSVIAHDATKRSLDVSAGLRGRGLDSASTEIRARLGTLGMPSEYHAELLSTAAVHRGETLRVTEFGVAAAIMLLLLLQAAFGSWRLAALSYLLLPVSFVGGVLAVYAGGGSVSLGSVAGFFALLAVAVRGSILLIRHYRRLERDEGVPFGPELVLRGARDRLAPTVMTTVGVGLALLPALVRGPVAGLEIIQPMAVVVLGGLVTTAALTLFVLPALYLRFGSAPFVAGEAEETTQVIVLPEGDQETVPDGAAVADPTVMATTPPEQT